jgi:hypothetical protein
LRVSQHGAKKQKSRTIHENTEYTSMPHNRYHAQQQAYKNTAGRKRKGLKPIPLRHKENHFEQYQVQPYSFIMKQPYK